ncbi:MAG: hypothetical protein MI756_00270 [Chromatiales bacterium]|nr:hypothetical protein [Chromatiales bacterium]
MKFRHPHLPGPPCAKVHPYPLYQITRLLTEMSICLLCPHYRPVIKNGCPPIEA